MITQPSHPVPAQPLTNLVRDWRARAAGRAVESLLPSVGCVRLSVDSIAACMSVAKGSAYLRRADVERLIETLLDRWASQVPTLDDADEDSMAGAIASALLASVECDGGARPAIPCCLHASPCPQGWNQRWDQLAKRLGLGENAIAQVVGEAIQAIASTSTVRELLAAGRHEDAASVVAYMIDHPQDPD